MDKLLNFDGRIRRQGYWIVGLLLGIPNAIFYFILSALMSDDSPNMFGIVIIWVLLLGIWIIGLSLNVRRWHDLNKSGWWVLINLVPFVGAIYSFIMLGFMAGDPDGNSYGPAPEPGVLL